MKRLVIALLGFILSGRTIYIADNLAEIVAGAVAMLLFIGYTIRIRL